MRTFVGIVHVEAGGSRERIGLCHRDRVGVLAHVLDGLREASINVQEMENVVFEGDGAACCAKLQVDRTPSEELQKQIRNGNEHVLALSITPLD